jgi:hypothetical protein
MPGLDPAPRKHSVTGLRGQRDDGVMWSGGLTDSLRGPQGIGGSRVRVGGGDFSSAGTERRETGDIRVQ